MGVRVVATWSGRAAAATAAVTAAATMRVSEASSVCGAAVVVERVVGTEGLASSCSDRVGAPWVGGRGDVAPLVDGSCRC